MNIKVASCISSRTSKFELLQRIRSSVLRIFLPAIQVETILVAKEDQISLDYGVRKGARIPWPHRLSFLKLK